MNRDDLHQVPWTYLAKVVGLFAIITGTALNSQAVRGDSLDLRISDYRDDVEEEFGDISRGSSDLDLGEELVGLRYSLATPPGAQIDSAAIQFTAKSSDSDPTDLEIHLENSVDVAAFSKTDGDVSNRLVDTVGSILWSPQPWSKDDAGTAQKTSDFAVLLQTIVNKPGWQSGQHIGIIISGLGERAAVTFDRDPAAAPQLLVSFVADESPQADPDPTPVPDPVASDTPYIDAVWPTVSTGVAAGFTPRRCCNDHGTSKDFHRALDLRDWWLPIGSAANAGDPVYAVADGIMIRRHHRSDPDNFSSTGGAIVIAHTPNRPIVAPTGLVANEFASYYLHLGSVDYSIQPGDAVYKGQQIGTVGDINADPNDPDSTWMPTRTSHLHFEIRAGVTYRNSSGEWKFDDDWPEQVSGEEFDGHINPNLILPATGYNNANEQFVWKETTAPVGVDCAADVDKVSLCYAFAEHESDVNEIRFTNLQGDTKVINFNTRQGVNPTDIDDFSGYNDVWISDLDWIDTADLTASNGDRVWGIKVQVPADWQPMTAEVIDIWGHTVSVTF